MECKLSIILTLHYFWKMKLLQELNLFHDTIPSTITMKKYDTMEASIMTEYIDSHLLREVIIHWDKKIIISNRRSKFTITKKFIKGNYTIEANVSDLLFHHDSLYTWFQRSTTFNSLDDVIQFITCFKTI